MTAPVVTLRALAEADRDRVLAWRNAPEVSAYMYTDTVIAPDAHARWLAAALADDRRRYWIVEMDGAPVGLANLYDIDAANSRCAWAYYLGDPAVRGRSVGAAVELRVLDIVFGEMGLTKLWCEVLETNAAVVRLHEKFGFVREALLRRHVYKQGKPLDVVGLGLLAEEWRATRPAMLARLEAQGFNLGETNP